MTQPKLRDYLAALVQLSKTKVVALDKRTGQKHHTTVQSINGVRLDEQITQLRSELT